MYSFIFEYIIYLVAVVLIMSHDEQAPLSGTGVRRMSANPTKMEEFKSSMKDISNILSSGTSSVVNAVKDDAALCSNAVIGFPSWFAHYLTVGTFEFYKNKPQTLYKELISGFTVAIMQVPESIAFSFVANVDPIVGLHATFWMALITGLFGGKPGMISGAAGALAVVIKDLTTDDGLLDYLSKAEQLEALFMTVFLLGIVQLFFAMFRVAKLVRLIPETAMIGFMNGLAIIIFMAQLTAFQKCNLKNADGSQALFSLCKTSERIWMDFSDDSGQLTLVCISCFLLTKKQKLPCM